MKTWDPGSSTQFDNPTWNGNGFVEEAANLLWLRLPASLRQIAISEITLGNAPECILDNKERGIVLLAFRKSPLHQIPDNGDIKVHRKHTSGNYVYDGTIATYEDLTSGCFLAFTDENFSLK